MTWYSLDRIFYIIQSLGKYRSSFLNVIPSLQAQARSSLKSLTIRNFVGIRFLKCFFLSPNTETVFVSIIECSSNLLIAFLTVLYFELLVLLSLKINSDSLLMLISTYPSIFFSVRSSV